MLEISRLEITDKENRDKVIKEQFNQAIAKLKVLEVR